MATPPGNRTVQLLKLLEKEPNDAFLLYGLALECKKAGNAAEAVVYLDRVIAVDAGYCYAYHQKGLILESTGDLEAAKTAYRQGIDAARRKGDSHAQSEIEAALSMIE